MALYSVNNGTGFASAGTQQAFTTTFKSLLTLTAETTNTVVRGFIYEINVGPSGVPSATDCSISWDLSAVTATGTASAVTMTATQLDGADATPRIVADANATVEPTYTANSSRWALGGNQRASYQWQCNPGGPGEIVIPATDEAGYGVRGLSTNYNGTAISAMKWRE